MKRCRIVVLLSGSGSNLQSFIDQSKRGQLDADIVAVIANQPGAYGLQRAEQAGIPQQLVNHRDYPDRDSFDQALIQQIDQHQPDLVILAGFMRILTADFVRHYHGRLLNIHPSLLPRYPGLHTHQRALDNGDAEAGATVHFVTEQLDGGPAIIQARVPVFRDDDSARLAARVLVQEHRIYPLAAQWFAEGRLRLEQGCSWLDQRPLPPCGVQHNV